eukprot:TRINITY_DN1402_c0_g1_i8.p2 TRINITY_DN1402_c0_g1~~TRINITY_DN1402_c0_g1_i8.p2  ORF type:complete len:325 (-),score=100.58 TRINITY_DN1402_c0_g1_i8:93-1067(-)
MSKCTEPTKTESVLAAIYDDSLALPKENEDNPVSEEKKHNPIPTDSNEGKLKLFLGGLYFQTEQDIRDYFKSIAPILQLTLITDRTSTGSKGYAFITLEDKDGTVRKKVLSTPHYIKDKIVDLKLEDSNKKITDQLSVNKKVFVGGLDPSVDASELRRFFERYGGVQDAIVIRNVATNVSRGFGFVTFDSEEVAERCVKDNNYKIKGKRVDIKRADPRQARQRQSRVYPLGGGGSEEPSMAMYYPPHGWSEMYPPNFPDPKTFGESGGSSMYPWLCMPSMEYQPASHDEGGRHSKESSRNKDKDKSEVGPIKDYKRKSTTYAPY